MTALAVITAVHIAALGMIESGNNDRARGTHGEVTRYQIGRAEMRQHPDLRKDPTNTTLTTKYTLEIWQHRVFHFAAEFNRVPTDLELYILWNAPAQILHPHAIVIERAQRFVNLLRAMSEN